LSHHFPPEVSAGANRLYELAREWVNHGHKVTVLTCRPNHPTGVLYRGYGSKLWQRERFDGIDVIRMWTFLAANKGVIRRSLSYLSYLISATFSAPFLPRVDIVVSSSPHFFCGFAGYPVSRIRGAPWVLDIRDLWPDTIVAVEAMRAGFVTRMLQKLERFAYRKSSQIVGVSGAFVPHFEACGIPREKISVVTNGVDPNRFEQVADVAAFRRAHGLEGKFVASYIGTHGMAHQLETILEAAELLRDRKDIVFVLIGDGAERENLLARRDARKLDNVKMIPQIPREAIPTAWAAVDAAIVALRPTPVFELVIPSKMFEAMVMRRPILLGVKGEAARIVREGECGLTFEPSNAVELADITVVLADDPDNCKRLGENGYRLVISQYDREVLAQKYLNVLAEAAGR
jgi:glycosyltransferase involved in cell wall biosynthesis